MSDVKIQNQLSSVSLLKLLFYSRTTNLSFKNNLTVGNGKHMYEPADNLTHLNFCSTKMPQTTKNK